MVKLKNYQRQVGNGLDIAWLELEKPIKINGETVRYLHIQFDINSIRLMVSGYKRKRNLEKAIPILDVQDFDNVLTFHKEHVKNASKLLSVTPVDAALVWVVQNLNVKI